jgi:hypothetical protein
MRNENLINKCIQVACGAILHQLLVLKHPLLVRNLRRGYEQSSREERAAVQWVLLPVELSILALLLITASALAGLSLYAGATQQL